MRLQTLHRPLIITALIMGTLGLISLGGLLFDDRVLLGAPIWLKPLKFSISLGIYAVTFAWLISLLERPRGRQIGRWLGYVISAASLIEMSVIVGQVVRGRASHFNFATPLDGALFSIMGVTIVVLWVATAVMGVLLLQQRIADRPSALAIRYGLGIALAGLAVGFLMTNPTPDQTKAMADGPPAVIGAHAVGVADGGPGLPLVNWSTEGGDLRAGHFVGMHALQALPLLAFGLVLLSRRFRRLDDSQTRSRVITVVAGVYAGLTFLVTWQALRGQPLLKPDGLTLAVGAAILVAGALGTVWAVAANKSRIEVAAA
ncbi:MAG TPA: hypothetical protein DGG94_12290 [Micromonosporaceae bacterium]|nr:hypothetical protein [Micromonosporaceae bacterium]HCU50561.1 hypothetical protein [Micromonosporaceae bacterium]